MSAYTALERRSYAIARSAEHRDHELAPLRAEVARAIAEVGWSRARPVVEAVLGPMVRVTGPRGAWRHRVGKRAGARIVAGLGALPVQGRLDIAAHPRPTVARGRGGTMSTIDHDHDHRPAPRAQTSVADPLGLERCAVCANAFGSDADEAATYRWRRLGLAGFVCRYCADEVGRGTLAGPGS